MKKQILMLAAIIPIMFFSCIKNDNVKKIESLSLIAEDGISTQDALVVYRIPVLDYSQTFTTSSDNRWKTYLLPD